jgi:hypothetical protein
MLTKDQAAAAGESIAEAARERARDARNASARRIPWYLSFDELRSLDPYQQAHIIAQASKQVLMTRSYWLAYALLVVVVVLVAVAIPSGYKGAAWLLLPCIFIASFALRTAFVRMQARDLVARLAPSLGASVMPNPSFKGEPNGMSHCPSSAGACAPFCACCPVRHAVGLPLNSNVMRWQPAATLAAQQDGGVLLHAHGFLAFSFACGAPLRPDAAAVQMNGACLLALRAANAFIGSWEALRSHRLWLAHACGIGRAAHNLTLKRSTNGMPPGPGRRYLVHFRQPGPGVTPLAPV